MKMRSLIVVLVAVALFATANMASAAYRSAIFANNYGYGTWKLLTTSYQSLISVTFYLPAAAKVYVEGGGYGYHNSCESGWALGYGPNMVEDQATRRFYSEDTYSQAMGAQTSKTYNLGAGTHTFHLLGEVFSAAGSCNTNYFTISAHVFETGNVTNGFPPAGDNVVTGAEDGAR
jgi:opacity protein-like surface antigen